jgi:glycosyltransferase involved in cell wall biosynthesis
MADPTLTLILPVYNVARHLAQCLDSLMAQTRAPDCVLAIDDGSTDHSPAILEAYASRMGNLKIVRQVNRGASAARNAGLDLATGDFVAFADSDDWVEPRMYQTLLERAAADGLDIAMCNGMARYEGRQADHPIYGDYMAAGPASGRGWLKQALASGRMVHPVWMHLYRRALLNASGLRFDTRLAHGEDVVWTTRALLAADRVHYDPQPWYNYRIPFRRFEPAVRDRRLVAIVASALANARTLEEIAMHEVADPELARLVRWQAADGGLSAFHKIEQMSDPAARKHEIRALRASGFFRLLWRNAADWQQKRRVVRRWMKATLSGNRRA